MAKDKFYFGKLDKWVSEKILEESWLGVILSVCLSAIFYAGFFWLPEIALFFGGATTPPQQHRWHMMLANFFCFGILFFTLLTVIKLLKKGQ